VEVLAHLAKDMPAALVVREVVMEHIQVQAVAVALVV
jgi:hypothetical protein